MTVALWRIGAIKPKYVVDNMSGTGVTSTGGRWNPVGVAVTYTSENIALAAHEILCIRTQVAIEPLLDVPDDVWAARQVFTPSVS
ncbi:RES family NAD+ phosphorylase [Pseudoduganella umbonata]|uniref:RES domain-containing protein n=1 Tax=Pseudoduganella umbonata TaxID=864828 RepID=A0A7W5HCV5_9BURK|nr:RES family NAD+ phosphorylase [Pseudoduganella umbonata]MBB3222054.1 RES domain-containing protein [Pseudoduganella umbonata]